MSAQALPCWCTTMATGLTNSNLVQIPLVLARIVRRAQPYSHAVAVPERLFACSLLALLFCEPWLLQRTAQPRCHCRSRFPTMRLQQIPSCSTVNIKRSETGYHWCLQGPQIAGSLGHSDDSQATRGCYYTPGANTAERGARQSCSRTVSQASASCWRFV